MRQDDDERRRRAREIRAKVRRQNRAAVLARQGQTGLTDAGERSLTTAQKHLSRALSHHDALSDGHDEANKHLSAMVSLHRKLTSTLANLGVEDHDQVARHLAAFDTHLRAARSAYEDSADAHSSVGKHVNQADRVVRSLLTGLEQSEPEDYTSDAVELD